MPNNSIDNYIKLVASLAGIESMLQKQVSALSNASKALEATSSAMKNMSGNTMAAANAGKSLSTVFESTGRMFSDVAKSSDAFSKVTGALAGGLVSLGIALAGTIVDSYITYYDNLKQRQEDLIKATTGLEDITKTSGGTFKDAIQNVEKVGVAHRLAAADVDSLIDSQIELVDQIDARNKRAEGDIAVLQYYRDAINGIGADTDKTAEDHARASAMVDGLNKSLGETAFFYDEATGRVGQYVEACGEIVSVYDEATGKYKDFVNMNGEMLEVVDGQAKVFGNVGEAIEDVIDAKMREIELEADRENLIATIKAQKDAQREYAKALGEQEVAMQNYLNYLEIGEGNEYQYQIALDQKTEAVNTARATMDSATVAVENQAQAMANDMAATDGLTGSLGSFINEHPVLEEMLTLSGESLSGFQGALTEAGVSTESLSALTDEQLNRLALNYNGTTESVIDTLAAFSTDAPTTVQVGADGILASATGHNEQIRSDYALTGAIAPGNLAESMDRGGPIVDAAAERLQERTRAIGNTRADATTYGTETTVNLASGIESGVALRALGGALSTVTTKIKNLLGHSVPKEGPLHEGGEGEKRWGLHAIQNLADGISLGEADIQRAVVGIAKVISDTVTLDIATVGSRANIPNSIPVHTALASSATSDATNNYYTIGDVSYTPDTRIAELMDKLFIELNRVKRMGVA